MLLSELIGKDVYCGNSLRGRVSGVCISLKSRAVKYLLCQTAEKNAKTEFSVSVTAVENVAEAVFLKRVKTVLPRNCARVFLNRPIYTDEGAYLGYLADMELSDFIATGVITGDKKRYPASALSAVSDAVILKKSPVYPLGQRIPAPAVSAFLSENAPAPTVVTRAVLKTAIRSEKLISFTLSLPPFNKNIL